MSSFSGFQRLATIRMSEFVILALLCLMKCFVKNQLLPQTPRDLRPHVTVALIGRELTCGAVRLVAPAL